MAWSPFDKKRTPLLTDAQQPNVFPFGILQLRPVYYRLVDTLLGGLQVFGPGDGIMLSVTPFYMNGSAPTPRSGFFYTWNRNQNDNPFTVGGFYHGNSNGRDFYQPLILTNYAAVCSVLVAGMDPSFDQVLYYQTIKGSV